MRIAIPLSGGQLAGTSAIAKSFCLWMRTWSNARSWVRGSKQLLNMCRVCFPRWLAEHGVDIVIAAGLGARARDLLAASSVEVLAGVSGVDPEVLVSDLVNGRLETGMNTCDHSKHGCSH